MIVNNFLKGKNYRCHVFSCFHGVADQLLKGIGILQNCGFKFQKINILFGNISGRRKNPIEASVFVHKRLVYRSICAGRGNTIYPEFGHVLKQDAFHTLGKLLS